ncbi:uncharacterized protein BKA78DRAFT_156504 [Phyllosticta capitalensis]|uniref:uncharacterized protein n=1 Tax=Phyllosticta capitalensis TaxID=121624 RepID=UPI00312DE50F
MDTNSGEPAQGSKNPDPKAPVNSSDDQPKDFVEFLLEDPSADRDPIRYGLPPLIPGTSRLPSYFWNQFFKSYDEAMLADEEMAYIQAEDRKGKTIHAKTWKQIEEHEDEIDIKERDGEVQELRKVITERDDKIHHLQHELTRLREAITSMGQIQHTTLVRRNRKR